MDKEISYFNSQGNTDYAKEPGDVEVLVTVSPKDLERLKDIARLTTLTTETIASTLLRKAIEGYRHD